MNKQIQKLIMQAGGIAYDEDGNELTPMLVGKDVVKFAELLIEQCIQAIQNESMNSGDEWEAGLRMAEYAIKTRFEVK